MKKEKKIIILQALIFSVIMGACDPKAAVVTEPTPQTRNRNKGNEGGMNYTEKGEEEIYEPYDKTNNGEEDKNPASSTEEKPREEERILEEEEIYEPYNKIHNVEEEAMKLEQDKKKKEEEAANQKAILNFKNIVEKYIDNANQGIVGEIKLVIEKIIKDKEAKREAEEIENQRKGAEKKLTQEQENRRKKEKEKDTAEKKTAAIKLIEEKNEHVKGLKIKEVINIFRVNKEASQKAILNLSEILEKYTKNIKQGIVGEIKLVIEKIIKDKEAKRVKTIEEEKKEKETLEKSQQIAEQRKFVLTKIFMPLETSIMKDSLSIWREINRNIKEKELQEKKEKDLNEKKENKRKEEERKNLEFQDCLSELEKHIQSLIEYIDKYHYDLIGKTIRNFISEDNTKKDLEYLKHKKSIVAKLQTMINMFPNDKDEYKYINTISMDNLLGLQQNFKDSTDSEHYFDFLIKICEQIKNKPESHELIKESTLDYIKLVNEILSNEFSLNDYFSLVYDIIGLNLTKDQHAEIIKLLEKCKSKDYKTPSKIPHTQAKHIEVIKALAQMASEYNTILDINIFTAQYPTLNNLLKNFKTKILTYTNDNLEEFIKNSKSTREKLKQFYIESESIKNFQCLTPVEKENFQKDLYENFIKSNFSREQLKLNMDFWTRLNNTLISLKVPSDSYVQNQSIFYFFCDFLNSGNSLGDKPLSNEQYNWKKIQNFISLITKDTPYNTWNDLIRLKKIILELNTTKFSSEELQKYLELTIDILTLSIITEAKDMLKEEIGKYINSLISSEKPDIFNFLIFLETLKELFGLRINTAQNELVIKSNNPEITKLINEFKDKKVSEFNSEYLSNFLQNIKRAKTIIENKIKDEEAIENKVAEITNFIGFSSGKSDLKEIVKESFVKNYYKEHELEYLEITEKIIKISQSDYTNLGQIIGLISHDIEGYDKRKVYLKKILDLITNKSNIDLDKVKKIFQLIYARQFDADFTAICLNELFENKNFLQKWDNVDNWPKDFFNNFLKIIADNIKDQKTKEDYVSKIIDFIINNNLKNPKVNLDEGNYLLKNLEKINEDQLKNSFPIIIDLAPLWFDLTKILKDDDNKFRTQLDTLLNYYKIVYAIKNMTAKDRDPDDANAKYYKKDILKKIPNIMNKLPHNLIEQFSTWFLNITDVINKKEGLKNRYCIILEALSLDSYKDLAAIGSRDIEDYFKIAKDCINLLDKYNYDMFIGNLRSVNKSLSLYSKKLEIVNSVIRSMGSKKIVDAETWELVSQISGKLLKIMNRDLKIEEFGQLEEILKNIIEKNNDFLTSMWDFIKFMQINPRDNSLSLKDCYDLCAQVIDKKSGEVLKGMIEDTLTNPIDKESLEILTRLIELEVKGRNNEFTSFKLNFLFKMLDDKTIINRKNDTKSKNDLLNQIAEIIDLFINKKELEYKEKIKISKITTVEDFEKDLLDFDKKEEKLIEIKNIFDEIAAKHDVIKHTYAVGLINEKKDKPLKVQLSSYKKVFLNNLAESNLSSDQLGVIAKKLQDPSYARNIRGKRIELSFIRSLENIVSEVGYATLEENKNEIEHFDHLLELIFTLSRDKAKGVREKDENILQYFSEIRNIIEFDCGSDKNGKKCFVLANEDLINIVCIYTALSNINDELLHIGELYNKLSCSKQNNISFNSLFGIISTYLKNAKYKHINLDNLIKDIKGKEHEKVTILTDPQMNIYAMAALEIDKSKLDALLHKDAQYIENALTTYKESNKDKKFTKDDQTIIEKVKTFMEDIKNTSLDQKIVINLDIDEQGILRLALVSMIMKNYKNLAKIFHPDQNKVQDKEKQQRYKIILNILTLAKDYLDPKKKEVSLDA